MASPFSDSDRERCERYYRNGLTDRQIADRLGVAREKVKGWRYGQRLPPNRPGTGGRRTTRKEHEERLALYRLGYSDDRIAHAFGRDKTTIRYWRVRNGLPAHRGFTGKTKGTVHLDAAVEQRREARHRLGWSDGRIAREEGLSRKTICGWRRRRGLPANQPERDWDRPATTMVSLDAGLGEDGFNRHGLVADDAASAWLEENGSTVW